MKLISLTALPKNTLFKEGDVFVLFGELFGRGYVNGLLKQVKECKIDYDSFTVRRNTAKNLS